MLKYFKKPADKTGFRIEFVKEGLHFTGEDSPMVNLLLSVMGAFAEFELALIRERQREGIALLTLQPRCLVSDQLNVNPKNKTPFY